MQHRFSKFSLACCARAKAVHRSDFPAHEVPITWHENLRAIDVQLTPADLREIETALSKIEVHGGRMNEETNEAGGPQTACTGYRPDHRFAGNLQRSSLFRTADFDRTRRIRSFTAL